MEKSRGKIISGYYDQYITKRMLGEEVDKEKFLLTVPNNIREDVRGDINNWEKLVGWKYTGSANDVDQKRVDEVLKKTKEAIAAL